MPKLNPKKILIILALFGSLELLSFAAWRWPDLSPIIFIALTAMVLVLSVYKLEYGLLAVLGELFIGSMGHLFQTSLAGHLISIRVALWAIIISVFVVKLLIQLKVAMGFEEIKEKGQNSSPHSFHETNPSHIINPNRYYRKLKNFFRGRWLNGGKIFWLLFLFIVVGMINGLARGHALSAVFADVNAWLYLALLFPLVAVYGTNDSDKKAIGDNFKVGDDSFKYSSVSQETDDNLKVGSDSFKYSSDSQNAWDTLKTLFFAGALWLSFKTLFLLFIFTHNSAWAPDLYSWLRRTLVGEMTPTKSGWPRIFIQGQIFPIIAFFLVFWSDLTIWFKINIGKIKKLENGQNGQEEIKIKEGSWPTKEGGRPTKEGSRPTILTKYNIGALSLAAIFFSVLIISFSRSFWVAFAVAAAFSLLLVWHLFSFKKAIAAVVWLIVSGLLSFAVIYLVTAWPYWKTPSTDFSADLLARVTSANEPALASRWSLLPVLTKEIKKESVLGQGFGATVTYFSRDPRILEKNPSGEYQTYAFEWGYLDIWLKIGLIGLLIYLFLLYKLISAAWQRSRREPNQYLFAALSAALIFLTVTNIFTPYLNHPLGLGFLLLSSCLIWPLIVY